MLRRVLIGVVATVFAIALACVVLGWFRPASGAVTLWSGVALAGLTFERFRYMRLLDAPPGPDWRDTGERFVDPGSRREVAVFADPEGHKRAYVRVE